jgi:hypothetical protein
VRGTGPLTARAAGIALVALAALVWAPALGGHARRPEIHDLLEYFYPVYDAFYGSVRAGAPLLWNPYQLCGMPWLGTLLPGFFYPPHAVYLVLPIDAAVALSSMAHLGLIAAGTVLFARRAGLSLAASVLAALVFALSATVRDWQRWPYHLEAGAWLPLGALGVLDLAAGARRRGRVLVAVALGASWLAGSPQVTLFLLYAWTALLVAMLGRGGALGVAVQYAVALAVGTLLAAVALLPALQLAPLTVRRAAPMSLGAMYPWGIPSPSALLWDLVVSRPLAIALAGAALAPLALAYRGQRRLALWALLLGLAVTALAVSPLTPLFDLYRALPGLAWFRGPNRLLFVSQFCLAILAGIGFDVVAGRGRLAGATLAALVAVAFVNLAFVSGAPAPAPNAGVRGAWPPALEDAYRRIAADAGPDRVWTLGDRSPAALPPKLPTVARLRSVGDYEPGALRRQAEYLTYLLQGTTVPDSLVPFEGRTFSLAPPPGRAPAASRRRLLDLAATRFVVVPAAALAQPDVASFLRDTGLAADRVAIPGVRVAANPDALPRAFVTYRAEPAPPTEELLRRLADARFDPLASSFVEGQLSAAAGGAPSRGAPASLVRDEPHVVEVDAELAAPGLVVLSDTWDPDWHALVDGVAAPIVATNHLFRGVWVPAGRHRVRFVYRPTALWAGAALSAVAALGLALASARRA